MRSIATNILGLALLAAFFVVAIIADNMVRSYCGGSVKIAGLPIRNATVTGAWKPDFLWAGKAWWIEIQSDEFLQLDLDGRTYVIPRGSHTVYSDHDYTNTGQFGLHEFWGYPENVEIRPFDRGL